MFSATGKIEFPHGYQTLPHRTMEPINIDDVISPEPICMKPDLPPRPSELPTLPTRFERGARFPFSEGQQFEFKETENVLPAEKLYETVCAFLNSKGGYLIVGIHDNGTIMGMRRKDCDIVLLRADSTIHTRRVVERDTARNISCDTLCAYTVPVVGADADDLFVVVLRVQSADHNQIFRMYNGDILIRLSASNYRTRSTTLVPYNELVRENEVLRTQCAQATSELGRYKQQYGLLERSYRDLLRETQRLAITHVDDLHGKILADKARAELRLCSSSSWVDVLHMLF
jgi:hypothetical protein